MSSSSPPTFVAKKVGDRYVVVPKNPPATPQGAAWLVGGTIATLYGAGRGGFRGLVCLLAGGAMLYRGATGCNPLAKWLCGQARESARRGDVRQTPSHQGDYVPHPQAPTDEVDEASMESFPASDPPAKMSSGGHHRALHQ